MSEHLPPQRFSRRRLLQAGAATAAAVALAKVPDPFTSPAFAQVPPGKLVTPRSLTPWLDRLPIPGVVAAESLEHTGLHAAAGTVQFHSQLGATPVWGYTTATSGSAGYLGPTILAKRGQAVSFRAHNRITGGHLLGVDTTLHGAVPDDRTHPRIAVHLHGGYVDPESDGGPDQTFLPGESWDFTYPNDQGASTLWYHDHALGITRLNAYAGLAGLYVIDDGEARPLPSGPADIPLALQDKSFLGRRGARTDNPLHYPDPWAAEFFGTAPVVNGKIWPYLDVDRGFYRFRLLNGSSSRFYHLRPSNPNRVPMWAVATDNGFLRQPVPVTSVIVSPGERVEIVLDLRNAPGSVTLDDIALPLDVVSPAPGPFGPMVQLRVSRNQGPVDFDPSAVLNPTIPTAAALAAHSVRTRRVSLVEHLDAAGNPIMSMLNNLHWDVEPERWEQPRVDTVEVWEIINLTADTHPIHLHLAHFLLLDRQPFDIAGYLTAHPLLPMGEGPWPPPSAEPFLVPGTVRPPRAFETGWKDTVQAHPGEVTRIVVPFGPGAHAAVPFGRLGSRFTGDYVWHCHILDHEDHEMMLPYRVKP